MNPKDKSIEILVELLLNKFGSNGVHVKDYWDGDLCAIGFTDKTEQYLVYVSTYGRKENEYFVSIEIPTSQKNSLFETKKNYENIDYQELEGLISDHLVGRI